ncbi:MAG: Ig-like domain-containing protein [Pseudomonadota bacterium]
MDRRRFLRGLAACLGLLLAAAAGADNGLQRGSTLLGDIKPGGYQLGALASGAPVYIDRTAVYTAVPAKYLGLDYLLTADAHADEDHARWITLSTARPTTVFVGYDAGNPKPPAWLRGWRPTGDQWKTTAATLNVLSRDFPAGTISLGGNGADGFHMYTVAVRPAPSGSGAPTAFDDAAITAADTPVFVAALANDRGITDQPLRLEIVVPPKNGAANPTSRLGLLYEPASEFIGEDSFVYRVVDADGDFDTGLVSIEIMQPTGDQPVANNDFAVLSESTSTTVSVLTNDTGLSDTPVVVSVSTPPGSGMAVVTGSNRIRYVPAPGFVGIDMVRYRVTDNDGSSDEATLSLLVIEADDAQPVAEDDARIVTADSPAVVPVLDNDTGLDDTPIVLSIAQLPANGEAEILGETLVAYLPDPGFTGNDSLTYRITDADGDTAEAQVSLLVYQPNRPPTIDGNAGTSVVAGNGYTFTPSATDPDEDDVLTFSIVNQPSWAAFDTGTGMLSGNPVSADVGTTTGIVISVSDGSLTASLPAFDLTVVEVTLGSVTLNWDPPLFNEDGSPVDDLAGYRVYLGLDSGSLSFEGDVTEPGVTSFVIDNLVPDTYWLAVSAIDLAGNESALSPPVSKVIEQQ